MAGFAAPRGRVPRARGGVGQGIVLSASAARIGLKINPATVVAGASVTVIAARLGLKQMPVNIVTAAVVEASPTKLGLEQRPARIEALEKYRRQMSSVILS